MHNAVGRDHLACLSQPAEASRDVKSRTAVTALNRDCLSRIDPDSDSERQGRFCVSLLLEKHLEFDRCSKGLAGRTEYCKRLVSA